MMRADPVPHPTSAIRRSFLPSSETEGWTTHGNDFFQMKWHRFSRTESITPRARGYVSTFGRVVMIDCCVETDEIDRTELKVSGF